MTTELQEITLESLNGTLAATNEQGHLTFPMLHIDREPVPEDAQGFDSVLVFVEGGVRIPGGEKIMPTTIVLFEENDFTQLLDIQTRGEWSISGVVPEQFQVDKTDGTGSGQIAITKEPSLSEPGTHSSSLTISITGKNPSETNIPVYIIIGGDAVDTNVLHVDLDEDNGYFQPLDIPSESSWNTIGVNSPIQVSKSSGSGNIQINVSKASSLTTPGGYVNVFAITENVSDELIAVVFVRLTVAVALEVQHVQNSLTTIDTAFHGETMTINLTEESNYAAQTLVVIRNVQWDMFYGEEWDISGVDTEKISATAIGGIGLSSTSYPAQYGISTTISKASSFTPDGFDSTTFRIVSGTQWVDVVVNFITPITGEFVEPEEGEVGTTETEETDPVYIYL